MYEYVSKKEVSLARNEIEVIINKVQDYLREKAILTFQYNLVGSASNHRHLVTRIIDGNKGFDLDYNIEIQRIKEKYDDAKSIKTILMHTFNMYLPNNYKACEDSSSVFTIKKIDKQNNRIIYSFDFAIVNYYLETINDSNNTLFDIYEDNSYEIERQEFITFNKKDSSYYWTPRPIASDHRYMERCVKSQSSIWNELRDLYIKNKDSNPNKKSRLIYYETLNQIFAKHFK